MLPFFTWNGAAYFAGTGVSDYGDGLFASGHEGCAGALLEAFAASLPPEVAVMEMRQVPPESPLLAAPAPPGWTSARARDGPCPVLQLAGENGMDFVPRRLLRDWRYALRRLEREGGKLDLVSEGDAPEAAADLERLHALRWSAKGENGVLHEPMTAALLRMHRLSIAGRARGILFAMHAKGRTFYYLSGYDPAWSRLSPGTALVGSAIAQAAREGATHFDFLRGQEPYKYKWGAEDRSTFKITLTRSAACA
jgi:CelD/BcsL family acetyltransferase involved in cellulose biosynthesis